jgi:lipopolysaccharide export system ATP-binding protein
VRRGAPRAADRPVGSSERNIDFGAGVGKNVSQFQSSARRQSSSGFWSIDISSLGGPITAAQTEWMNLPVRKRPQRPPKKIASPPIRPEVAPEPPQARAARESSQRPAHAQPEPWPPEEGRRARVPAQPQAREAPAAPSRDQSNIAQIRKLRRETAHAQPVHDGYLATRNVEKSFAGRKVVRGASLYVRRGEAVGLLGPNGAGKTTIFYMITGLIKADSGRVELDGHDITRLPMYQRARLGIGYLPQEASIFRGLNVEDNIKAVLEVIEPNKRRRAADLDALLEEFGLTRLRKTPTIALSGGERRRVEIARALATRPNYMLLDEPFAGIDPIAVGDIQDLVIHLKNRGIGVLITDHNVRETLGLTDRAYIIYSGKVLMEGRADDIVNDPEVRRLYLGEEFRM